MDHRITTMAVVGRKRTRLQDPPPQWDVVRGMLHMRIKDVAAELDVPVTYLRHLCHQNGFPTWPGKRIRFMNGIGRNLPIAYLQSLCRENSFLHWPGKNNIRYMNGIGSNVMLGVDARDGSPWAGLAGPSQLAMVAGTKKEEEDMTRIVHETVANPPPGEELVTLNLLDKVGSSSSSEHVCQ